MRPPKIECTLRRLPHFPWHGGRLVVLEILCAEYFVYGQTTCVAINPDGTEAKLDAFRSLVGRSWGSYTAAVLEIHSTICGWQSGVREYELFETYVVPDEPLEGKPFPRTGSRRCTLARGNESFDVFYSPEVAMLPVSMLASDTCPVTNRPRSDGKWIKVGECRPIVPTCLSNEEARMGLQKAMPNGQYHPPYHQPSRGKARARGADNQGQMAPKRPRGGDVERPEHSCPTSRPFPGLIAWVSEAPHLKRPNKPHKVNGTLFRKPPSLDPPAHPWHRYPVIVTEVVHHVPPVFGASGTYAVVEAVLPGGPTWTVHKSQLLKFVTLVHRRWAARADTPDFCASVGMAAQMDALRQGIPLPLQLRRLFPTATSADAPIELCAWLCVSPGEFDEIVTEVPQRDAAAAASSRPLDKTKLDDGYISPTGRKPAALVNPPLPNRNLSMGKWIPRGPYPSYLPVLMRVRPPTVKYTTAAALRALADEARRYRLSAALAYACEHRPGEEEVRRLLKDGASLGVKSPEGEPCLWIACRRCATGCVKALLEAGADATTPYKGESLLEMMRSEDRDCAAAKAVIGLLEAHLAASHPVVGLPGNPQPCQG
ncbi:hypothetical protein EMIHUDRAFT_105605 [Emiliania huxleyi CCMP1516]|uniref:Uncharacterized protein n=2 Tax=Emiliania huxleyi TaxID=2903 RepID=A0A0D3ID80_EMIH1|nr:hypothetical protein EMIHUDRAFT_105605 [Emiliania huxleyi CCMP1516]EOD09215.1 hypothetical protein EMIHUDRAFT_105605 [Emiliania huxleyi CCMP1516]|eukprot:XP_005761644.1 hypothetical protein EMIHUDRAFT_105605 [Emiliania huxleyi CCMP1516]